MGLELRATDRKSGNIERYIVGFGLFFTFVTNLDLGQFYPLILAAQTPFTQIYHSISLQMSLQECYIKNEMTINCILSQGHIYHYEN